MKWLIDGRELDLPDSAVSVDRLPDRLVVHTPEGAFTALAVRQSGAVLISYRGGQYRLERPGVTAARDPATSSGEIRAVMPGIVVSVNVQAGELVNAGQTLLVIEAMKTQQPVVAPFDGTVARMEVTAGNTVSEGIVLAFLSPSADTH